jgi:uncharacterized membrane protein
VTVTPASTAPPRSSAAPPRSSAAPAGVPETRRSYIDWLRGIAVLIMIEAHTLDSWTRVEDRPRPEYAWSIVVGGFGAPTFLFLAGVAIPLAIGTRVRRGATPDAAAALARRRALQIFGLAFLFRLQSWIISGGGLQALLKVDILNIMGLSMLVAAIVWTLVRGAATRAVVLIGLTIAAAMATPLARVSPLLAPLPDPIEWYLRPFPGRTTFTMLPWAGFLLGGAAVGMWLDATRDQRRERWLHMALAAIGVTLAAGGYAASFLPPIYQETSFWTSSPTFFFLRLGVLIAAIPIAYCWNTLWRGPAWLHAFGLASLFVYWIHVELVYGVLSMPIHRRLTFEQAVIAYAAFTAFMYWLVTFKDGAFVGRVRARIVNSTHRTSG